MATTPNTALEMLISEFMAEGMSKDDAEHDALVAYAEATLTQADCEAWSEGETTDATEDLIELFARYGYTPQIWGTPNGVLTVMA